jgi:polyisoprenoid-binding protein YceI
MTKLKAMMLGVFAAMILVACSSSPKNEATVGAEGEVATAAGETYALNTGASTLGWKGSKITGDNHVGNLDITEGSFSVDGGKIVAGNFTVDMKSISTTDYEPGSEQYGKLIGHLQSPDFFSADSFPTASFEITKVVALQNSDLGTHSFSGNLTIKDITHELTFPATVEMTDGAIKANAAFAFDRSLYNVRYGSGKFFDDLGDNLINDEIELTVSLEAKKPAM